MVNKIYLEDHYTQNEAHSGRSRLKGRTAASDISKLNSGNTLS